MEDRRIKRTKEVLKKALIDLIQEKEIDHLTVKDIVDKADYNRATFYRHYNGKEDLLTELMKDRNDEFIYMFEHPYKHKHDLKLSSLTAHDLPLFNYLLEHADYYRLLKYPKQLPCFQDELINTIVKLFRDSIVHFYQDDSVINNDLLITYRAYGLYGLIREWIHSDFKASPQYLANQLIQIVNYRPVNISIFTDKEEQ